MYARWARGCRDDMPAYAELHAWSNFTFLEGGSHPEELIETARGLGLRAIALTDRDGLYGAVRFAKHAKACGVAAIIGALVIFAPKQPLSFFFRAASSNHVHFYGWAFLLGLLQAQWTFTGYAGSCHLSEETIDPRRRVPGYCPSRRLSFP